MDSDPTLEWIIAVVVAAVVRARAGLGTPGDFAGEAFITSNFEASTGETLNLITEERKNGR